MAKEHAAFLGQPILMLSLDELRLVAEPDLAKVRIACRWIYGLTKRWRPNGLIEFRPVLAAIKRLLVSLNSQRPESRRAANHDASRAQVT